MLSVAVMMLFSILFPPAPPPKQPPAGPAAAQQGAAADGAAAAGNAQAPAETPDQPAEAAPAQPVPQVVAADVPTQYLTLGSLDPASGYRMMATITNTGAAVHRAEMTSPRYRDQHDRSGYLGELEVTPVEGGVKVQAVGAGTPAAVAGIAVGDVLTGIAASPPIELRSADELRAALAKTEPGDELPLQVRGDDGAVQTRTAKLGWRPFAALRPEADNYRMRGADLPPDFEDPASFLVSLDAINDRTLGDDEARGVARRLVAENWEIVAHDETTATLRRILPELNLEIIKRYTLQPASPEHRDLAENADHPAYHLQLDVELRNTAAAAQSFAYRLDGPTGMPLEGWWYAHKSSRHRWFGGAGLRDVVVRFHGHQTTQFDCPQIAEGEVEPAGDGQALSFAGVDGQYFAAILMPQLQSPEETWFDTTEAIVAGTPPDQRTPVTYTNVTCRLTRQALQLAPGAAHRDSYQVFIGPKRPELLSQYHPGGDPTQSLSDVVYYGLALFGAVARAMLAILHFFYSIVGNYGIAIVMLTVLVRGAMFPISFKQTKNMARMQALKPEMDRITEKYKTDMQKRSQAIQELYRKHQVNPLAGCLPVFLQLPIFIGLYRALMVDVELRLSPLFGAAIRWCSNLAAPDMFLDWSRWAPEFINNGQGIFGLGPYLNILPLVTVALFLVTQKMAMPVAETEQAIMQQKMMKWMTIFMGLLFYKVASGLCLYFIASSLWGIAERKLLPKATAPGGDATGAAASASNRPPAAPSAKPGANGSPQQSRPPKSRKKR